MSDARLSGRCLCGSVRWTATAAPVRNLICHCESCQRATSSAFAAFLGFAPHAVQWDGPKTDYQSSPGTWRGFCPTCGSRLYFRSDKWPEEIHLHAGTLDDPAAYAPDRHVVIAERVPWLDQIDSLPTDDGFGVAPRR
jgi:hypothetical protein